MSIEYNIAVEQAHAKLVSSIRTNLAKLLDNQMQADFSFNRELEEDWLNLDIKRGFFGKLTLFPWFGITKPTFEVIQYKNGELTREKRQMVAEEDARERLFNDKNFLLIPGTRKIITPKQIDLDRFEKDELVSFAETVESNLEEAAQEKS